MGKVISDICDDFMVVPKEVQSYQEALTLGGARGRGFDNRHESETLAQEIICAHGAPTKRVGYLADEGPSLAQNTKSSPCLT
jgi:hypothetical protein